MDRIAHVAMRGVAAAVPKQTAGIADLEAVIGPSAGRIAASIGVSSRRIAGEGLCSSDLCEAAASNLLADLGWTRETIDVLIMVTQTPDYVLPATACVLHGKLALPARCAAFDVNLGCSGYVYGLWLASRLLGPDRRRAILLAGDTLSKLVSPEDRSVAGLFGDGGTATALEWADDVAPWTMDVGTQGTGAMHLAVPAGAFRRRAEGDACVPRDGGNGNVRAETHLRMDGAEVMAFSLREVTPLISRVMDAASWTMDDLDAFVPHQANRMMLEQLRRRSSISPDKLIVALDGFGNTGSASIPLTLATALRPRLAESSLNLLLVGFGVGFSWAAATLPAGPLMVPALIEL